MSDRLLSPGRPAFFLAVRLGVPGVLAFVGLAGAILQHGSRGWWLLLTVACGAELGTALHRGTAYYNHRAAIVRWEGRWVQALRPLVRLLGFEEAWLRSFLAWNNRRVESVFRTEQARRPLVLLPHCIQAARCGAEIHEDLERCHRCGLCPLGDALAGATAGRWDLRVFNRSHKAARCAREIQPDLMVAVSCTDRLIKGILKLPETPCFAIPLDLPHGMCVDTTFDPARLEDAMSALARPRTAAPANVQPLQTTGIA